MRRLSLLLVSLAALCAQSIASISIITPTLPNGTVGIAYSSKIAARNGCTPYVWAITGTLPPGFISTVNAQSLSLSGTPTAAGSYSFNVAVKGCGGRTATASYTVSIGLAPIHVVILSWTASTSNDVAGYNMYRGTDGVSWQKINSGGLISWTTYSDSSDANHTTYYYAATAVDIYGAESVKSTPVQVRVP